MTLTRLSRQHTNETPPSRGSLEAKHALTKDLTMRRTSHTSTRRSCDRTATPSCNARQTTTDFIALLDGHAVTGLVVTAAYYCVISAIFAANLKDLKTA